MDIMTRKKKTTIRRFPKLGRGVRFSYVFSGQGASFKWILVREGSVLLARSGRFPEVNFLGIERPIRVNRSGRKCERAGRENVRLLRMEGYYAIRWLMPRELVSTYYFFFRIRGRRIGIMIIDCLMGLYGCVASIFEASGLFARGERLSALL